jgi:serine/threonine-protein kinase
MDDIPHDTPDLRGQIVGSKYRVEQLIGAGGMGTVWQGVHITLGTKVAIKFIKPAYASHPDTRKRFEIEARAAAKLRTRHAVAVHDFGVTDEEIPYLVMDYLEGCSLSEHLIATGAMSGREVGLVIGQAAQALAKAHAAGIVHRDLKPDNIFLATNSEDLGELGYCVKLVDFGIAKMAPDPMEAPASRSMGGLTQEGAVVGTPNFMSPEQLTVGGAPGPLTDIWSLGACAFTAMTARIPFEGDILGDIVLKVCVARMPVPSECNPEAPPGFDAWFAKACARDPAKRFQTVDQMRAALERVCGIPPAQASTTSLTNLAPEPEEVQYVLKPASQDAALPDDFEVPSAMSPRTALLAGLVLGLTVMIGVIGAIAWRARAADQDSTPPHPDTVVAPDSHR